ncbi:GNAT family N-acetyltransferase, partial [Klebsiella michiganensis]
MMILKDKEHVDSVDWLTVAEIIAAAGLNQRDVALVE